jgi:hypothetical protein
MKGISQGEHRGLNKYKLNYTYVNYNNKTGFYKNTSQTYTIGNAKNVITCFGHQKCHTSSSSSSDSGASDEGLKTIIQFFV